MESSKTYVQVHTHPRSTSFSFVDIILLLAYNEIKAMVVFGLHRKTYLLLKLGEVPSKTWIKELFVNEYKKLFSKYEKRLKKNNSSISEKRVADKITEEVIVNIAPILGLKYVSFRK